MEYISSSLIFWTIQAVKLYHFILCSKGFLQYIVRMCFGYVRIDIERKKNLICISYVVDHIVQILVIQVKWSMKVTLAFS